MLWNGNSVSWQI